MKEALIGLLVRRIIGYAGVAGVVGLDNDLMQVGSALAAVCTLLWSIYGKIKAANP